jgi:uncharacterized protein
MKPVERLRQIASALLIAPIHFYRYVISPMLPPACRYVPTCSQYAIEAIRVHGPLKGLLLAVRRLLRCHPITWLGGSHGYDPVPPR